MACEHSVEIVLAYLSYQSQTCQFRFRSRRVTTVRRNRRRARSRRNVSSPDRSISTNGRNAFMKLDFSLCETIVFRNAHPKTYVHGIQFFRCYSTPSFVTGMSDPKVETRRFYEFSSRPFRTARAPFKKEIEPLGSVRFDGSESGFVRFVGPSGSVAGT